MKFFIGVWEILINLSPAGGGVRRTGVETANKNFICAGQKFILNKINS